MDSLGDRIKSYEKDMCAKLPDRFPDSLGDRIKSYEKDMCAKLPDRFPVIMRLDGRAFHSFTRGCSAPFDDKLMAAMDECAISLCKEISGAQMAYVQSDEISILIHGYKRYNSQPWFGNKVQKMVSVAAGIAAATMSNQSKKIFGVYKMASFDARVFIAPEADVNNVFVWRQQAWTRNSVQMLARSLFSHKECENKNNSELQDMIHDRGSNWNDLPTTLKRGRCIIKETYLSDSYCAFSATNPRMRWVTDNEIPIFTQDTSYIEKFLQKEEG